eukprot:Rmarinus@m.10845
MARPKRGKASKHIDLNETLLEYSWDQRHHVAVGLPEREMVSQRKHVSIPAYPADPTSRVRQRLQTAILKSCRDAHYRDGYHRVTGIPQHLQENPMYQPVQVWCDVRKGEASVDYLDAEDTTLAESLNDSTSYADLRSAAKNIIKLKRRKGPTARREIAAIRNRRPATAPDRIDPSHCDSSSFSKLFPEPSLVVTLDDEDEAAETMSRAASRRGLSPAQFSQAVVNPNKASVGGQKSEATASAAAAGVTHLQMHELMSGGVRTAVDANLVGSGLLGAARVAEIQTAAATESKDDLSEGALSQLSGRSASPSPQVVPAGSVKGSRGSLPSLSPAPTPAERSRFSSLPPVVISQEESGSPPPVAASSHRSTSPVSIIDLRPSVLVKESMEARRDGFVSSNAEGETASPTVGGPVSPTSPMDLSRIAGGAGGAGGVLGVGGVIGSGTGVVDVLLGSESKKALADLAGKPGKCCLHANQVDRMIRSMDEQERVLAAAQCAVSHYSFKVRSLLKELGTAKTEVRRQATVIRSLKKALTAAGVDLKEDVVALMAGIVATADFAVQESPAVQDSSTYTEIVMFNMGLGTADHPEMFPKSNEYTQTDEVMFDTQPIKDMGWLSKKVIRGKQHSSGGVDKDVQVEISVGRDVAVEASPSVAHVDVTVAPDLAEQTTETRLIGEILEPHEIAVMPEHMAASSAGDHVCFTAPDTVGDTENTRGGKTPIVGVLSIDGVCQTDSTKVDTRVSASQTDSVAQALLSAGCQTDSLEESGQSSSEVPQRAPADLAHAACQTTSDVEGASIGSGILEIANGGCDGTVVPAGRDSSTDYGLHDLAHMPSRVTDSQDSETQTASLPTAAPATLDHGDGAAAAVRIDTSSIAVDVKESQTNALPLAAPAKLHDSSSSDVVISGAPAEVMIPAPLHAETNPTSPHEAPGTSTDVVSPNSEPPPVELELCTLENHKQAPTSAVISLSMSASQTENLPVALAAAAPRSSEHLVAVCLAETQTNGVEFTSSPLLEAPLALARTTVNSVTCGTQVDALPCRTQLAQTDDLPTVPQAMPLPYSLPPVAPPAPRPPVGVAHAPLAPPAPTPPTGVRAPLAPSAPPPNIWAPLAPPAPPPYAESTAVQTGCGLVDAVCETPPVAPAVPGVDVGVMSDAAILRQWDHKRPKRVSALSSTGGSLRRLGIARSGSFDSLSAHQSQSEALNSPSLRSGTWLGAGFAPFPVDSESEASSTRLSSASVKPLSARPASLRSTSRSARVEACAEPVHIASPRSERGAISYTRIPSRHRSDPEAAQRPQKAVGGVKLRPLDLSQRLPRPASGLSTTRQRTSARARGHPSTAAADGVSKGAGTERSTSKPSPLDDGASDGPDTPKTTASLDSSVGSSRSTASTPGDPANTMCLVNVSAPGKVVTAVMSALQLKEVLESVSPRTRASLHSPRSGLTLPLDMFLEGVESSRESSLATDRSTEATLSRPQSGRDTKRSELSSAASEVLRPSTLEDIYTFLKTRSEPPRLSAKKMHQNTAGPSRKEKEDLSNEDTGPENAAVPLEEDVSPLTLPPEGEIPPGHPRASASAAPAGVSEESSGPEAGRPDDGDKSVAKDSSRGEEGEAASSGPLHDSSHTVASGSGGSMAVQSSEWQANTERRGSGGSERGSQSVEDGLPHKAPGEETNNDTGSGKASDLAGEENGEPVTSLENQRNTPRDLPTRVDSEIAVAEGGSDSNTHGPEPKSPWADVDMDMDVDENLRHLVTDEFGDIIDGRSDADDAVGSVGSNDEKADEGDERVRDSANPGSDGGEREGELQGAKCSGVSDAVEGDHRAAPEDGSGSAGDKLDRQDGSPTGNGAGEEDCGKRSRASSCGSGHEDVHRGVVQNSDGDPFLATDALGAVGATEGTHVPADSNTNEGEHEGGVGNGDMQPISVPGGDTDVDRGDSLRGGGGGGGGGDGDPEAGIVGAGFDADGKTKFVKDSLNAGDGDVEPTDDKDRGSQNVASSSFDADDKEPRGSRMSDLSATAPSSVRTTPRSGKKDGVAKRGRDGASKKERVRRTTSPKLEKKKSSRSSPAGTRPLKRPPSMRKK